MTIAAIATPHATGGIGIIRISGPSAVTIASRMFRGTPVEQMKSHTVHLGKLMRGDCLLDEALLCLFKAPNSYTGEDVVEFHCHGGLTVCRLVLDCVIANGARAAQPGEFTRRAFLNGKLDLSQAEAVGDLISAQTETAVTVAANQLERVLSDHINAARDSLKAATAHLLATIDFSEEGVEEVTYDDWKASISDVHAQICALLQTANDGRLIKDGIHIALAGTTNTGKSSLLNAICGEDRAIVTEIEGTTRDVLEAQVNIRGHRVNLYDTAGIRESEDAVEQIGVQRAKKAFEQADLVLFLLDGSRPLCAQDEQVMHLLPPEKTICLINKADLPQQPLVVDRFSTVLSISALTGQGLDALFEEIARRFAVGDVQGKPVVTNERHKECLLTAQRLLSQVLDAMLQGAPFDLMLSDVELAIGALGEITGMTVSEEIIDHIFSTFCVGK